LRFHGDNEFSATVLAVHPPSRFGRLTLSFDKVIQFDEKSTMDEGWINGGFMVMDTDVIDDLIDNHDTVLEREPLERLARLHILGGYKHNGFWACMDTLRDWEVLEEVWNNNIAPWKVWND